jgi:Zn-dependent protease
MQSRLVRVRITLRPPPLVEHLLLLAPVLLFSIIAHEIAHGYAALSQGDTTARDAGRLTWNPIKHIDPLLSVVLPLVLAAAKFPVLAGAKPVPVNPQNYRNFRRGDIIVSLAGIAANISIAAGCAAASFLCGAIGNAFPSVASVCGIVQAMALLGVELNIVLAVFNLLPIPPLDGSHVFKYLLPPSWAMRYQQVGFVGIFLIVLLLKTHASFLQFWLTPALGGTGLVFTSLDARALLLPSALPWLKGF